MKCLAAPDTLFQRFNINLLFPPIISFFPLNTPCRPCLRHVQECDFISSNSVARTLKILNHAIDAHDLFGKQIFPQ